MADKPDIKLRGRDDVPMKPSRKNPFGKDRARVDKGEPEIGLRERDDVRPDQPTNARKTVKATQDAKALSPSGSRSAPAAIRITATVLNIDRGASYYEVTYRDLDGRDRTKRIGRELFLDPRKVVEVLVKAHADLPMNRSVAVASVDSAVQQKADCNYKLTARSGWHDAETFVYPTATYGKLAGELLYESSSDIDPALGQRLGTLAKWREGMKEPMEYSDYLLFACSVPIASTLLDVIGEDEGALFHLHGTKNNGSSRVKTKSSSGKTLSARAAASITGRCRKTELVTFAATVRGVEDYCFAHNHIGAVFDEEGRSLGSVTGPRVKSDHLPYLVPSGRGGLRSNRATRDPDLENLVWSLFGISTGENPLDDVATRPVRPEGAQVRMMSMPVPPGKKGGIFNRVKGNPAEVVAKSKTLSRQVEDTIAANFGVVMPEWLPMVVEKRPALARRVRQIIDRFIERVGADTDPWERRFAEKFGIVLAAAVLLAAFGIAPWTENRARIAITHIYQRARSAVASVDEAADALVARLRKLLAQGKRFPMIRKGQVLSSENAAQAWGARMIVPKLGPAVVIPYARVQRLVQPSAITSDVLRKLAKDGVVQKANDGKLTRELMVKSLTGSRRRRFVCLYEKRLLASAS